ncbi:MAG: tetratricopeptide repeat protein [Methanoregula sp.]|jgi:tetratricopeptide (TPR) repeat protein
MNSGRYLTILAIFLVAVLAVQPALAVDNLTDVVAGPATGNVTKTVVNYTADLEKDAATKLFNYGQQSVILGDFTNAISYYDQALAENRTMLIKTDAILYLYQGKAYSLIQLEKYNDAITTADEGLALYPKDAMLWNNRGYSLYRLGKTQEALVSYNSAISHDGNYTNAYINKGNVLSDMGKYSEAVAAYKQANETDPFNIAAYDGLEAARKNEGASSQTTTIILVVVLIAAAGIVVWYVKFRKPSEPAPEEKKKRSRKK